VGFHVLDEGLWGLFLPDLEGVQKCLPVRLRYRALPLDATSVHSAVEGWRSAQPVAGECGVGYRSENRQTRGTLAERLSGGEA